MLNLRQMLVLWIELAQQLQIVAQHSGQGGSVGGIIHLPCKRLPQLMNTLRCLAAGS